MQGGLGTVWSRDRSSESFCHGETTSSRLFYWRRLLFDNTLTGHDTVYNPDDDNVNPTNDNQNNEREFTYADADEAIKQPEIMPRIFVAILYNL